ncbi:MAG: hypothetical protein HQK52_08040 [Oligoflexia bacterium]|nr:hypothetical protein [Oligoflexia bacterium]
MRNKFLILVCPLEEVGDRITGWISQFKSGEGDKSILASKVSPQTQTEKCPSCGGAIYKSKFKDNQWYCGNFRNGCKWKSTEGGIR